MVSGVVLLGRSDLLSGARLELPSVPNRIDPLRVLRNGGACEEAISWICQPRLLCSVAARAGSASFRGLI